jgi:hypothetical protein
MENADYLSFALLVPCTDQSSSGLDPRVRPFDVHTHPPYYIGSGAAPVPFNASSISAPVSHGFVFLVAFFDAVEIKPEGGL